MQGTYREKGATKTLKISVEVRSGAVRFRVSVRAESIERALEIAKRHNPGRECKVTLPIDTESFFVKDTIAKIEASGMVAA